MPEEFAAADFCTGLFDEFFFAGLTRDNVIRHLLKLLWYIHPKLPTVRLQTLMKALAPTQQHSDKVHALYQSLQEKIDNQQEPSVSMELDDFNSPLMNVPTPAPFQ